MADSGASRARRPFREGFVEFYASHLESVVGLAYVLSGSRSGAEELAQDAFLKALLRWDRVREYDDPGSWVRRVVANAAVSRFRRIRAEARALIRIGGADFAVPMEPGDEDRVWQAVRELPARQAQVIALHYLDELSVEEVAGILDVSLPTVKTHLQRGRAALSRRFGLEAN